MIPASHEIYSSVLPYPEAVTVSWPTLAGKQYTLHFSPDLTQGSWLTVGSPYIANGGISEYTFAITGTEKSFWRVTVVDADSDNDGLTNHEEGLIGTNSYLSDSDSDMLSDHDEITAGTDPNNPDSDGDGIPDGWEVDNGLDPNDPADTQTIGPVNLGFDEDISGSQDFSFREEFPSDLYADSIVSGWQAIDGDYIEIWDEGSGSSPYAELQSHWQAHGVKQDFHMLPGTQMNFFLRYKGRYGYDGYDNEFNLEVEGASAMLVDGTAVALDGDVRKKTFMKDDNSQQSSGSQQWSDWQLAMVVIKAQEATEGDADPRQITLSLVPKNTQQGGEEITYGGFVDLLPVEVVSDLNNDGQITAADNPLREAANASGATDEIKDKGTEFIFHNDTLSNGIWDKEDTDPAKPATEKDDDDAEEIRIKPGITEGEVWLEHPAIAKLSFYKTRECKPAEKVNLSPTSKFTVSASNPFPDKLFMRADVDGAPTYPEADPQFAGDLVLKIKVGTNGQEIEAVKMKLTVVKQLGAKKYFHTVRDYIFENNTKTFTQEKAYGASTKYRIVGMREESTFMSGLDTYDHATDAPRLRGIDEVKANYTSDVIINGNQCFHTNIGGYPLPGGMTNRCDGRLCVARNILRPPSDDTHNPNLGGPGARYVGYTGGDPQIINGQVTVPSEYTFATGQIPEANPATPDQGIGGLAAKYDRPELQQSENQAIGRGPAIEQGKGVIFTATTYVGNAGNAIDFAADARKSGVKSLSGGDGSQWELLFLDGSSSVGLILTNPQGIQKTVIKGGKHDGGFTSYYINTYLLFECEKPRN